MSVGASFIAQTKSYEAWRAARIPVVAADLETKHTKLAQSPFVLLRGTYYRFLKAYPKLLPALAEAPAAVVVGDLHIENFGTWRDRDSRLAWGINDFDEIDVLPYTIDLVRLATSAVLAIRASHLAIEPSAACAAVLDGWRERIAAAPVPFVLGERHPHLDKLASEAFVPPARFARQIAALPAFAGALTSRAHRLLHEAAPWPGYEPTLHARTAGVGSLGSLRVVAVGDLSGGLVVREAKQIPGPASMWATPERRRVRGLAELVASARGVAADPWRRQTAKWVLRPLAPDAALLELAGLRRKHDEAAFLRSMGAEAANVHLIAHRRAAPAKALRRDAEGRPSDWLHAGATKMAALTERDHAAWRAAGEDPRRR
jgi:hypothetical protein